MFITYKQINTYTYISLYMFLRGVVHCNQRETWRTIRMAFSASGVSRQHGRCAFKTTEKTILITFQLLVPCWAAPSGNFKVDLPTSLVSCFSIPWGLSYIDQPVPLCTKRKNMAFLKVICRGQSPHWFCLSSPLYRKVLQPKRIRWSWLKGAGSIWPVGANIFQTRFMWECSCDRSSEQLLISF